MHTPKLKQHHSINRQQMARVPIPFSVRYFQAPALISIQRYCCFVLATEKDRESAKNFLHQKRRFLGVNVVEIIREEKKGGRMKMDMGRGMDAVAASSD